MCVTNIYVDRYPDGRELEFSELSLCVNSRSKQTCPSHSFKTHHRKIETVRPNLFFPSTPPRSAGSSHHGSPARSDESHRHRRKHSKDSVKATRQHRKERIVIVDAPPTPRTPPQMYPPAFTTPSSLPESSFRRPATRPIIVDERTIRQRPRTPSFGAVVGDRTRPIDIPFARPQHRWDTPPSSRPSYEPRISREFEDPGKLRRERERADREAEVARQARRNAEQDAEAQKALRIAQHNKNINARRPVPLPRTHTRPVVNNSQVLPSMMGALNLEPRRTTQFYAPEAEMTEQRLRERLMPKRRFSVGAGHRRPSTKYPDGVLRWE